MKTSILQLEINEVAWRFMNEFRGKKEFPNIDSFFKKARSYTSVVVDSGEMSPWVVWPTIHRGVNEDHHKIRNLGQDPKTFRGTPIWKEIRDSGKSVGVFGALQSWPAVDPGPGGFFVPDTFAHDEHCFPKFLEPLQKFNLDLVAKNMRVREGTFLSAFDRKIFFSIARSGVRWKTLFRVAGQLLREKIDPRHCARRAIFQNILFWDVFKGLYSPENPPAYASYFTNHIAGSMHRYWNSLFPNDFPEHLRPKDEFHRGTLDFSMRVLDEMLADVLSWMEANPDLTVILVSGLGQDTKLRTQHEGIELILNKIESLMHCLEIPEGSYKKLLAMTPLTAIEILDEKVLGRAISGINELTCASGEKPFSVCHVGPSVSISLATPSEVDCRAGYLVKDGFKFTFSELGIRTIEIEAGTAYHIPEGVFAIAGPGRAKFSRHWPSEIIPDDKIKGEVMHLLGIAEKP